MTIQKTSIGFEGEASRVSVQPVGNITSTNVQDALDQLAGLVAPKDAEYLVGLADGDLPNARVPTNTSTISWDFATANQAKANIADADLLALAGLSSNGIATRTATDTWAVRTITGTANEITATNGDGVSGNPVLSLPAALTFTGKTITGGTYSGIATTGTLDVQQALALTGDISPSQITSDQNDYAPTGLSTAAVLRLNTDASHNLTGLAGGADGRVILIHNVGSFALVLKDENASSTAGNRFALSTDVTLSADQSTMLQYDSTSSRWRVIGGSGGSGGGDALKADPLSQFAATTSAQLAGVLSDETGFSSGAKAVFSKGPTIETPILDYPDLKHAVTISSPSSPTQITADQNDYTADSTIGFSLIYRISTDSNSGAGRAITGLAASGSGLTATIVNVGSYPLTLKDENTSSTAGYRFSLSTNIVLLSNESVSLWYDGTISRWRMIGRAQRSSTHYIGEIITWATGTPPTGTLECDGSAVSRTTYAALYAVIGTIYGTGDGSTTFNLPDYRGQFLRGWAHGSTNDPDRASRTDRGDGTMGDNIGTKQGYEIQAHTHNYLRTATAGPGTTRFSSQTDAQATTSTGGNETRPRNVNIMFCIVYQ